MERLPQELIDHIIDNFQFYFYDNVHVQVLRQCSLVCRSWLPRSQRHLFHRIIFKRPTPCFDTVLPEEVPYSERLYRVLLESPHLADYIKELGVYDSFIGDQTLPLVLRKLKNLEKIEIWHTAWISSDLRQSLCWVFQLPSIRFAKIAYAAFGNINEFATLLHYAQGLNGLTLYDIKFNSSWIQESLVQQDPEGGEPQDEQKLQPRQKRRLSYLNLRLEDYPIFVDWLLGPQSAISVSRIHTLQIWINHQNSGHAINQLLRAIGTSLKYCKLCLPYELGLDINMESNSNIKFLHLANFRVRTITQDQLPWLLHFLSTISSSNKLKEIKLEVDIPSYFWESVDWSVWERVDNILAGDRFKFLQKLNLKLSANGYFTLPSLPEMYENMAAMLPLLKERGVLVYCSHGAVVQRCVSFEKQLISVLYICPARVFPTQIKKRRRFFAIPKRILSWIRRHMP